MVDLRINSVDDSNTQHSTRLDIYSTYEIGSLSKIRTNQLNVNFARTRKGDPLVVGMTTAIQKMFEWGRRRRNYYNNYTPDDFKVSIVLPNSGNTTIMIEKKAPYYKMMEQRMTKKNMMVALCRTLYRSCYEKEPTVLLMYLFKMINLPENVSYVLENKTPYWFIDIESREKQEVRLNTKLIGTDTVALEISDGVWGTISVKDLDKFVNYFHYGQTRTKKWAYMSPKKLWEELMDAPPTTSQEKLMVEFLCQNRTQDIVENRAKELMESLTKRYPNRIKIIDIKKDKDAKLKTDYTAMLIRGKIADWIIIDSSYKTEIQKVKTFVFIDSKYLLDGNSSSLTIRGKGATFMNGHLRGPICIDNVHNNSSVGDQYAARGLALLNDNITIELVHTISNYIPKELKLAHKEKGSTSRLNNWDALTGSEKDWGKLQ